MKTPESRVTTNEQCQLLNLNWGYQICDSKQTKVIMAITDTQEGPERSEECTTKAKAEFERITRIMSLYAYTPRVRYLLADLIQANGTWVDPYKRGNRYHWNTVKPLLRTGLAIRDKFNAGTIRLSDEYLANQVKTDAL